MNHQPVAPKMKPIELWNTRDCRMPSPPARGIAEDRPRIHHDFRSTNAVQMMMLQNTLPPGMNTA